jgi:hypothetical protein
MAATPANSENIAGAKGAVLFDGTATFSTANGTSGQVLTANGTSSQPTFQAASSVGASLILLQSQTASSSTSLDFTTGTNLYGQILVVFYGVNGATAGATLNMRISNNAGSTYVATGYQSGCNVAAYNTGTWTNTNSTTAFLLTGGIKNTDGNSTANGKILIGNANIGAKCFISGTSTYQDNSSSNATMVNVGGQAGDTGANAFRFLMSSGNIAQGVISLYGIRTS